MASDDCCPGGRDRDRLSLDRAQAPTVSAFGNEVSSQRGAAATRSAVARHLLRVEGVTYTIPELARAVGRTEQQVRTRASKLIHRRKPYTLDDFRG
jgi:hypothetical protein